MRPSGTVRYRATMKKSRPKLALRTEMLRALSSMDFVDAVGGRDIEAKLALDVTDTPCPAPAAKPK